MEKTGKSNTIMALAFIILLTGLVFGKTHSDFERGKIIKKVVCLKDPDQHYALLLPADYSDDKKWPIIYAFDPAARGTVPLKHFKDAALMYGYIVVCSYNSQNGPHEPAIKAMNAVWNDTLSRFSIDKQRIYATGFSGGARLSSFFSKIINNPVQGIIACGAGLSSVIKAEQIKPTHYYGIVGVGDYNYSEMKELEKTLAENGIRHRMVFFKGIHSWPRAELCTQAVEWMEIQAIKDGHIKENPNRINDIFQKEVERATDIEMNGQLLFAVQNYRSLMATFGDYKDTSDIQKKTQKLTASKKFKQQSELDQKLLETEKKSIQHFIGIFAYITRKNVSLKDLGNIINGLKIRNMEKRAGKKKDIFKSGLYTRLLAILNQKARRYSESRLKQQDHTRAIIFSEIAVRTSKNTAWYPYDLYRLACCYAMANKTKSAFNFLEQAADAGFLFPDYIKKDKYMNPIKDTPGFKKILNKIEQKLAEKKSEE
jgi:predicted esterase